MQNTMWPDRADKSSKEKTNSGPKSERICDFMLPKFHLITKMEFSTPMEFLEGRWVQNRI